MALYYIHINLFCLFLMIAIFFRQWKKGGVANVEQRIFNSLIITAMFMCISDVFAWVFLGRPEPWVRPILEISNMVYYFSITLVAYFWAEYVCLKIWGIEHFKIGRSVLRGIPCLAMLIIILINPFTKILFSIDAGNNYMRSDGVILHWIISWGYLVVNTVLTIIFFKRAKNPMEKAKLRPLLLFVVAPALAAVAQMIFYGVTATQCGITLSIILVVIQDQQQQISTDNLTGLNNRNSFNRYIDELLRNGSSPLTVMMCDVDNFKKINDSLGHVAGDNALKDIVRALKNSCKKSSASLFLFRYGGDEFVLCSSDLTESETDALKEDINWEIKLIGQYTNNLYNPSISIGVSKGICYDYLDVEDLIAAADAEMHKEKTSKIAEGAQVQHQ